MKTKMYYYARREEYDWWLDNLYKYYEAVMDTGVCFDIYTSTELDRKGIPLSGYFPVLVKEEDIFMVAGIKCVMLDLGIFGLG